MYTPESNILVGTHIAIAVSDNPLQRLVQDYSALHYLEVQFDDDERFIYGSKYVTNFVMDGTFTEAMQLELSQGLVLQLSQGGKSRDLYAYIAHIEADDESKTEVITINVSRTYDEINRQKKQGRPYVYRGTNIHLVDEHRTLRKPREKSTLLWFYNQLQNGPISAETLYQNGIASKVITQALEGNYVYLMVDNVMLDRGINDETEAPAKVDTGEIDALRQELQRQHDEYEILLKAARDDAIRANDRVRQLDAWKASKIQEEMQEEQRKLDADRKRKEEMELLKTQYIQLGNNVLPMAYRRLKELATIRENIMLTGSSGSGKTFVCSILARDLGLQFGSVSCSEGMTESQLSGLLVPYNGGMKFLDSEFVKRYEQGGIFLFDEMDSADANTLNFINTALANDQFHLPLREANTKVEKHPDFICIAATNTLGDGASKLYSGRTQLDAATLDRFRAGIIEWEYNNAVERKLADEEVYQWCLTLRKFIKDNDLPYIVSTRVMLRFTQQKLKLGYDRDQWETTYFTNWHKDDVQSYRDLVGRMNRQSRY